MSLLRDRDFRRLFLADTASQVGSQVLMLALPLVAVSVLHASEFDVGLLVACQTLAFLVVGLPAGAIVDRLPRRSTMIVSDAARALLLTSVPVAWWLDLLTIEQVYAVAFALGVFTVFFDIGYQSYLPHLVARERLVEGNSALETVRTIAQVGGPGIGGYLIQVLTAPVAFFVTAAGFVWSALCLRTIAQPEMVQQRRRDHLVKEIREGLVFVVGHPLLRRLAGCSATANLFLSMIHPMVLVLLVRELGIPAGVIGLLMAAGGLGGVVSALINARVVRWFGQGTTLWLALVLPAPFMLLVPLAEADWRIALVALSEIATGAGMVLYNVTQLSFRQAVTPAHLLGRTNATIRFLICGVMPVGGLLGGVLGTVAGVRWAIFIAAVGVGMAVLWLVTSPLRLMREFPVQQPAEDGMRPQAS
ncbi:MFS transporter [Nonomuraea longispora]|uniref:MFS transporter n=1 Tax=Nonomuraea longispora TaxID=1848320 RepID=A0A4R4N7I5_9ACTN|nr:MFS transporter [Nonomuraea longispora]TDC04829.1 MFS transporter [Nonomuraea longispora]